MFTWQPPLADMRFVLHEMLGAEALLRPLPGFGEVGADLMDAILAEAGKFAERAVLPLNRPGDLEGCRVENGAVRTPEGYRAAWKAWVEAGWSGIACRPEDGGQGLPAVLDMLVTEMACSASLAFSIYPGLTAGAYRAILAHGDEALKRAYLPKLATGEWTGAMALTEPHAGSDLGILRTRAAPAGDGSFRVTGTKMFISAGVHDLAPNIVHLVLARLPDAPAGTRGISLFLVPLMLPDGSRNALSCASLEHKMGLNASPTCVMNYDGATGWLVGEPHQGLPAMFTMMNAERLFVGVQGVGAAECALQTATAYARERLQGRSPAGPQRPDLAADPIIHHPDVRRMLATARATTEAGRMLAAWVAILLDRAERLPPGEEREAADDLLALMTPVLKAAGTDFAFEACVLAQQVLGGHGYLKDWGVEQLVRDVRITQIYEGTNGIQALDLAGRKLSIHGGRLPRRFFALVRGFLAEHPDAPGARELSGALSLLEDTTAWLADARAGDPLAVAAAAGDYLRLFALVSYGWLWSSAGLAAEARAAAEPGGFHAGKLATARFFAARILPQAAALAAQIRAGSGPIMAVSF